LGVYVPPDLMRVSASPFTQRPAVQYGYWPISEETTGNPGRRENTKQARDQGMLEELQYRNRDGIKEKRVRIVREVYEEEGGRK